MRNQQKPTFDDVDLEGEEETAKVPAPVQVTAPEMLGMGGLQGPAMARQRKPIKTMVKRYRVAPNPASADHSGNWAIVYNRAPTTIRAGKEVDERSFDLKALRDRGVILIEIESIEAEGL